ncbi:MAG TPA: aspartate/glutamate racemase family protein [Candidatus Limnocylindria bacterium]|nr:aspartate/glutamate racemase family protein [Candidatus Limnocylindria bacterium]
MKIVYLVPGLMPDKECRRREAMLRGWACPGTQVDVAAVTEGPASIESLYEEYLAIPATVELAMRKEEEGYDAAIVGCAGDPGVDAIRELATRMAVFGPGASSFLAAAMLGHRFGVLTPEGDMTHSNIEMAFKAGVREKLAASASIGIPVLEMMRDRQATIARTLDVSRRMMKESGADTLVIGCMTLAFLDIADELSAELGVPVVNPASVTLRFTESMAACGLRPSKAAYPLPPKLKSGQAAGFRDLFGRK